MARSDESSAWCPVCGGDGIEHTPIGTKPCRKGPHTVTRSDERAAVPDDERDEIARGFGFEDHASMLRLMAARGLHVVTAAQMRVLEAMRDVALVKRWYGAEFERKQDTTAVATAELARREAEK